MVKKESKKIPTKNYVIALILILGAVLITFYAFELYKIAEEKKIAESYLMKSNTILHEIKNLKELNSVLLEAPEDYYIYISYTNSKDVYDLEKSLKPIIKDYHLKEEFYFLNITDMVENDNCNKNNCSYLDEINSVLDLPIKIEKVPVILYFRDGELVVDGIAQRLDNKVLEAGDFQQLLDKLEIRKTDR